MRRQLITLALALSTPVAALAANFQECVTQGDEAFASHDYQRAENAYIDALYATHSEENEKPLMAKLDKLYKTGGLTPLDATVKEKLDRYRKAASKPTPPRAVQAPTATASYPLIQGPIADKLLSFCKEGIENSCRDGLKGFTGVENFQGAVHQLPSKNYQVTCFCDAVSTQGRVPIEIITEVKQGPDKGFIQVSLNVIPTQSASAASQNSGFSDWVQARQKDNAQADAAAKEQLEQEQQASKLAEEKQLQELEEKTRQLEEMGNSSNQKSKVNK